MERDRSELQGAPRKRRDRRWMFPRSTYGCVVSETDHPANVTGKAQNSLENLLPLQPCCSRPDEAAKREGDVPVTKSHCHLRHLLLRRCRRRGAGSSGSKPPTLTVNYFFSCFMRRCPVRQDNNFKNWISFG